MDNNETEHVLKYLRKGDIKKLCRVFNDHLLSQQPLIYRVDPTLNDNARPRTQGPVESQVTTEAIFEAIGAWRSEDDHGTALQIATVANQLAMCEFLLRECRINVDIPNDIGWTPLMWAVFCGLLPVAQLLVKVGRADPRICDNSGKTLLAMAVEQDALASSKDTKKMIDYVRTIPNPPCARTTAIAWLVLLHRHCIKLPEKVQMRITEDLCT